MPRKPPDLARAINPLRYDVSTRVSARRSNSSVNAATSPAGTSGPFLAFLTRRPQPSGGLGERRVSGDERPRQEKPPIRAVERVLPVLTTSGLGCLHPRTTARVLTLRCMSCRPVLSALSALSGNGEFVWRLERRNWPPGRIFERNSSRASISARPVRQMERAWQKSVLSWSSLTEQHSVSANPQDDTISKEIFHADFP